MKSKDETIVHPQLLAQNDVNKLVPTGATNSRFESYFTCLLKIP